MTRATSQAPAAARHGSRTVFLAACLITIAIGLAYANSLGGGFVFDDVPNIPENPTIRHLWPLSTVLNPPSGRGATVQGRPILNLSFALNYAFGGAAVQGYHAVNVAIHLLASLLLFGIVRRTLEGSGKFHGSDATAIACVCSLIFGLHPLQTESVTYMVQRAESLMGLFFLLSLYGAIRAAEWPPQVVRPDRLRTGRPAGRARPPGATAPGSGKPSPEGAGRSRSWSALSIAAAWLCAGTKEVAVALPIVVILYDRTFIAGSFAGAWRKRRGLYAGLASSWLLLACLVLASGDRGGTIGPRSGVTSWDYALCQSRAIFHYVKLCFWPAPLIFDYGTDFVTFRQALPWAIVLIGTLSAVVWAVMKRTAPGFLGAWFFMILAPTSSFVGGTRQMLAEHRMYLSLAAVVVGTVLLLHRLLGRSALALGLAIALVFGFLTAERNQTYRDSLSLYRDTVLHRPNNAWAHYNLGQILESLPGGQADAIAQYETALRLKPDYAEAHYHLGSLLAAQPGREADAVAHFETALRLKPDFAAVHNNWGALLARQPGRQAEAITHFEAALRLNPDYAEAHYNLAALLAGQPGRLPDAIVHLEAALRVKPDYAEAHYHLGQLLARLSGRQADAIAEYQTAARLLPNDFRVHYNLAQELGKLPDMREQAVLEYAAALKIKPDFTSAREALQRLLGIDR